MIGDAQGSGFISAEDEIWEFYVLDVGTRPDVITVSHRTPWDPTLQTDVDAMLATLQLG